MAELSWCHFFSPGQPLVTSVVVIICYLSVHLLLFTTNEHVQTRKCVQLSQIWIMYEFGFSKVVSVIHKRFKFLYGLSLFCRLCFDNFCFIWCIWSPVYVCMCTGWWFCRMCLTLQQVKIRVVSCFLTWACWISATTSYERYPTTSMSLATFQFSMSVET